MREHDAHLPVAALGERDCEPGVLPVLAVKARLDRPVADAVHSVSPPEGGERALLGCATHPHPIAPPPAPRRMLQLAGERAVVGQQQQPLGVEVEPSDGDDVAELLSHFLEHGRAALRVAVAGDEARRLVIAPEPGRRRRRQGRTVHGNDAGVIDVGRRVGHDGATKRDPAGGDQPLGVAPRAEPRPGDPLGDALATLCRFRSRPLSRHAAIPHREKGSCHLARAVPAPKQDYRGTTPASSACTIDSVALQTCAAGTNNLSGTVCAKISCAACAVGRA